MKTDCIEVDWYVMGIYHGKRKIGYSSVCGCLLSGNLEGAQARISAMDSDLNKIPGVQATSHVSVKKGEMQ